MLYKIDFYSDKEIEKKYKKFLLDLAKFYGFHWKYNTPRIIVVKSRKMIDSLFGRKTENWTVGWSEGRNVFILARNKMSRESSHKNAPLDEYLVTVKHELSHAFFQNIFGSMSKPRPTWLWEGVAVYASGQIKLYKKPKKLSQFLDYYDHHGQPVYNEACFFIDVLIKKFGKEKLIKLIKSLKEINSQDDFKKLFKKIYRFDLNYKTINDIYKD